MRKDLERFADELSEGLNEGFLDCFKPLDAFEEAEARWIIPGWMPEEQITLLASDGGVGKTSLWISILSALSCGERCFLDPPDLERAPMPVAFLTTEDSVSKKLKKKLRLAGANERNILTMDLSEDKAGALRQFKFGTERMAQFIRAFRPAVCVFDPVQGFIPPETNMASRNAMRDCMAPLIALGEEVGTSFLVVCHTNKRKGASGRDRISDSADLWDVARCVWMAGTTGEDGVRYLSNEKNNYALLQETRLFSIDGDGQVVPEGTTRKRDRDYMLEYAASTRPSTRKSCRDWILAQLAGGEEMPMKDLHDAAAAEGYSDKTMRRAMEELYREQIIESRQSGYLRDKRWYVKLLPTNSGKWARDREKH